MPYNDNRPTIRGAKRISGETVGIVSSGTVNVPGSYVQLVSATTGAVGFINIDLNKASAANLRLLVEFAIGGGGSEVVVSPLNITITANATFIEVQVMMPIDPSLIPAGSRIACRLTNQTDGTAMTVYVGAYFGELA